jgi:hypothetical protein
LAEKPKSTHQLVEHHKVEVEDAVQPQVVVARVTRPTEASSRRAKLTDAVIELTPQEKQQANEKFDREFDELENELRQDFSRAVQGLLLVSINIDIIVR